MMVSGFIYAYTQINPSCLPARKKKKIPQHRKMLGRPQIHNRLKTILIHSSHTYTSTSQSRDHVIMSELGNNFAWSTRPRRSTIDSAPIILRRHSFSNNCPPDSSWIPLDFLSSWVLEFSFLSVHSFFSFVFTTIKDACLYVYASHLFNISLSFYFPPSTASTISHACNGDLFAAHDVHILSQR